MNAIAAWNFHNIWIWLIAAASIALVLIRPKGIAEAWWSAIGACCLVWLGLVSPRQAIAAVLKGSDVYMFLAGMMMMSELARAQGVFDWVAGYSVRLARGSLKRLFVMIYSVGAVVTILLSNDATAVVLTPQYLQP